MSARLTWSGDTTGFHLGRAQRSMKPGAWLWSVTIKYLQLCVWVWRIESVGCCIWFVNPGKVRIVSSLCQCFILNVWLTLLCTMFHYSAQCTPLSRFLFLRSNIFYNNNPSAASSRKRNRRQNILNIRIMLYYIILISYKRMDSKQSRNRHQQLFCK